jgi:microcystin-dependent protein
MAITALPPVPSRSDTPADFITKADAFLAALPLFRTEANAMAAAMTLNAVNSTSVTSLSIGTGLIALTVEADKSYVPGMTVKVASTVDATNWMLGDVTSYNPTTGALEVNVSTVQGSGVSLTAWTISSSAPGGAALNGSPSQDFSVRNLYQQLGSDIASAATIDLDAANGDTVDVTGAASISAITLAAGRVKRLHHTGAQTLVYSASLITPGSKNIKTQAGDYSVWIGYPGGIVRCMAYLPVNGLDDVGFIKAFAGTAAPAGYLACPTVATNISRTTYAALFAAIGTTWGAGNGSTTFGMPWFPANYALVQGGTVGSATVGQMPSHTHGMPAYNAAASNGSSNTVLQSTTANSSVTTDAAGSGSANLAAGHRVLMCVKY